MSETNHPEERDPSQAEQTSSNIPVEDIATAAINALPSEGAKRDIVAAAINSLPPDAYDAKTKIVSTALKSLAQEDRTDLGELVQPTTPPLLKESDFLLYGLIGGGLCFILAALVSVAGLVVMTLTAGGELPVVTASPDTDSATELVNLYLGVYFDHIVLLLTAALSSLIGFMLFRTAGAASRDVIPWNDRRLLSSMLTDGNSTGIDQYVRLSSLSGTTGFFTKIGLSGLPLATIGLTLIFAVLSLGGSENFAELAKLTLGAFLGSYVQRQVGQHAELESPRSSKKLLGQHADDNLTTTRPRQQ